MKITDINIDIVERNLEFVGDNIFQASGVTGGIVHQGILRIKTDQGIEGNSMVGGHRGDSISMINNIFKKFLNLLKGQNPLDNVSLWTHLNKMPKASINRFTPLDYASFSAIDVALVANVTVGAFSLSVIVIVTDCVPLSLALPPETPLIAIVAVSFEAAS